MNLRHRFKFAGLAAALALFVGACASGPPSRLDKAQSAYQQAAQGRAAQYAPTTLAQARKALRRAQQAKDNGADDATARTLSYIALRRAQQAKAQGEVSYLAAAQTKKRNELYARTDAARKRYRRQLVRQKQIAKMNAQQLEQKREQLQKAREDAQKQAVGGGPKGVDQQAYDEAIAKLDGEIERRKQAEQKNEQLKQRLDKVANVRQEDGRGTVITLDNSVLFEFGKSDLLPNARQRLEQVANALKVNQDSQIVIEGHTDSKGSEAFNEQLSDERAQSVRDFLTSRGVPQDRVDTVGYGEDRPIASNDSPEGRAMNRRVEIVVDPEEAVGGGPQGDQSGQQNDQSDQQDDQSGQQDEDSQDDSIRDDSIQDGAIEGDDIQLDQPMGDEPTQQGNPADQPPIDDQPMTEPPTQPQDDDSSDTYDPVDPDVRDDRGVDGQDSTDQAPPMDSPADDDTIF